MLKARALLGIVIGVGLVAIAAPTSAQPYPSKLIRIIAPFPPGGPTDGAARLIADRLSTLFGQTVVVENRPGGAGGTVGVKSAASAEPDGYTILLTPPGPLITAPAIFRNVGYDPLKAFTPVAAVFSSPHVLVTNPSLPAKSMQELAAYAKANPGKVSYASPGFSTQPHLLGEMIKLMTGADIVHVPYKGSAPALTDLVAGQVQMYFDSASFLLPHIESGRVRVLAVADERRLRELPDTPTTIESGFGRLLASYWVGVVVPAGTPAAIVDRLNGAINEVITSKAMEETLAKLVARPRPGTPQDFAKFMAAETAKWTETIKAANIRAD
ncbi:MAG: tripartite tricarboxylate transporter substrate binding protein [Xanthobacteraceae bacterium]|nr:tripartite tricarboxylate transporter substrate binding protein [Xanthobacteraceae bacterium]